MTPSYNDLIFISDNELYYDLLSERIIECYGIACLSN